MAFQRYVFTDAAFAENTLEAVLTTNGMAVAVLDCAGAYGATLQFPPKSSSASKRVALSTGMVISNGSLFEECYLRVEQVYVGMHIELLVLDTVEFASGAHELLYRNDALTLAPPSTANPLPVRLAGDAPVSVSSHRAHRIIPISTDEVLVARTIEVETTDFIGGAVYIGIHNIIGGMDVTVSCFQKDAESGITFLTANETNSDTFTMVVPVLYFPHLTILIENAGEGIPIIGGIIVLAGFLSTQAE